MARFAYYNRLSARNKAIYRRSDEAGVIVIPAPQSLGGELSVLMTALKAGKTAPVRLACENLSRRLIEQLGAPPVKIKVLSKRPSDDWGELQGLYDPETAELTLWMRTAQRKQVVAFKTFLRTLLHELCHHFDYALLKLEDSFHTEGFYQRESAIYKQLLQVFETEAAKES
jgi:hypothetical protein